MGRAHRRRPGLAIGGRRGSWPAGRGRAAPNTHADSGGPAPQGQAAVPGVESRPVPIRIRSRLRGHSKSGGLTSPRGGASSARLTGGAGRPAIPPPRGCGPAGAGGTWAGASAPSPYTVRQPRADLVSSPGPPPGRGPVGPPRSVREQGAAGVPSNRRAAGAAAEDTRPGSRPSDIRVSSLWLAPSAPVRRRLAGRPVAQGLTKRLTSNTSFVCSMW
jgi:hypothetical protein